MNLKNCVDCGAKCYGNRCRKCFLNWQKDIWSEEKRKEQARKVAIGMGYIPPIEEKELLESYPTRSLYFLKKYRGFVDE